MTVSRSLERKGHRVFTIVETPMSEAARKA